MGWLHFIFIHCHLYSQNGFCTKGDLGGSFPLPFFSRTCCPSSNADAIHWNAIGLVDFVRFYFVFFCSRMWSIFALGLVCPMTEKEVKKIGQLMRGNIFSLGIASPKIGHQTLAKCPMKPVGSWQLALMYPTGPRPLAWIGQIFAAKNRFATISPRSVPTLGQPHLPNVSGNGCNHFDDIFKSLPFCLHFNQCHIHRTWPNVVSLSDFSSPNNRAFNST